MKTLKILWLKFTTYLRWLHYLDTPSQWKPLGAALADEWHDCIARGDHAGARQTMHELFDFWKRGKA